MIKFLDLHKQYLQIQDEIDGAISQVIARSQFVGGETIRSFEANFAAYQGVAECVGVGNGTDALEIAIEALDLPHGSEVVVPANSFTASAEAVARNGLKVVFADADRETCLLDLQDVQRRITARTSAILCVHLYGDPCDMTAIAELAAANGLKVIEDCAQAHGAEWRGQRVGGFGDVSTFSFYPGKNLGAYGDAGAICTNDAALARRARMIANHGRVEKYNHEIEGRNSRLDGLQAAVLDVKLAHLDGWLDRRREIARCYVAGLRGVPGLTVPDLNPAGRQVFHLFVVRHPQRDELAAHLAGRKIQTGIHYPIALPRLQAYAYLGQSDEPMTAFELADQVLSLPMGEHLTDQEVDEVIDAVTEFCRQRSG